MKLIWTNEALKRLSEIDDYIAQDSVARAKNFIAKIIRHASSLTTYPEKGRIVPEFNSPNIREIIYKNYRIVYRLHKGQIQILTSLKRTV